MKRKARNSALTLRKASIKRVYHLFVALRCLHVLRRNSTLLYPLAWHNHDLPSASSSCRSCSDALA